MPKEKDPIMKVIEKIIEKFGDGCRDWFRSEVVEIIKYRRQVKRESSEPDIVTLLEKLAEKAAKYGKVIKAMCVELNLVIVEPPPNRIKTQNPTHQRAGFIFSAQR